MMLYSVLFVCVLGHPIWTFANKSNTQTTNLPTKKTQPDPTWVSPQTPVVSSVHSQAKYLEPTQGVENLQPTDNRVNPAEEETKNPRHPIGSDQVTTTVTVPDSCLRTVRNTPDPTLNRGSKDGVR